MLIFLCYKLAKIKKPYCELDIVLLSKTGNSIKRHESLEMYVLFKVVAIVFYL